jgi:hypothetical protein
MNFRSNFTATPMSLKLSRHDYPATPSKAQTEALGTRLVPLE